MGVKRTSQRLIAMSAFDPKRTSAGTGDGGYFSGNKNERKASRRVNGRQYGDVNIACDLAKHLGGVLLAAGRHRCCRFAIWSAT